MNKRIVELANKANETVGYTFSLVEAKQLHELMEKFAELIVRECAELMSGRDENGNCKDGDTIKKHFGVEL